MGQPLAGRTAIVTGAGRGIGAETARALGRAGAGLVLADADGEDLDKLAAELAAAGHHAVAVPADLGSAVAVRRLVEQTLGAFGRLDLAVNHAAARRAELAARYQVPPMRRAGGGRVVNLATDAVTRLAQAPDAGVWVHTLAAGSRVRAEDVVRLCWSEPPWSACS